MYKNLAADDVAGFADKYMWKIWEVTRSFTPLNFILQSLFHVDKI